MAKRTGRVIGFDGSTHHELFFIKQTARGDVYYGPVYRTGIKVIGHHSFHADGRHHLKDGSRYVWPPHMRRPVAGIKGFESLVTMTGLENLDIHGRRCVGEKVETDAIVDLRKIEEMESPNWLFFLFRDGIGSLPKEGDKFLADRPARFVHIFKQFDPWAICVIA